LHPSGSHSPLSYCSNGWSLKKAFVREIALDGIMILETEFFSATGP